VVVLLGEEALLAVVAALHDLRNRILKGRGILSIRSDQAG
jgi:hypothetical protein